MFIFHSSKQLLILSALLLLFYIAYTAIYRLLFSPIAKFPGPRRAGPSFWYEFYYDLIQRGRYTFKIRELHKQDGRNYITLATVFQRFDIEVFETTRADVDLAYDSFNPSSKNRFQRSSSKLMVKGSA